MCPSTHPSPKTRKIKNTFDYYYLYYYNLQIIIIIIIIIVPTLKKKVSIISKCPYETLLVHRTSPTLLCTPPHPFLYVHIWDLAGRSWNVECAGQLFL